MTTGGTSTLDEVKTLIQQLDDEIQDTLIQEETEEHIGYLCKRRTYSYFVQQRENSPGFNIIFPFDMVGNLAQALDAEVAEEYLSQQVADEDDPRQLAVMEILERMSPEKHQEFRYHLGNELATPDCEYQLISTEFDRISGFEVGRAYFPDDDSCGISEFSHSVNAVINAGHSGVQFVHRTFDIEAVIDEELASNERVRYLR